MRLLFSINALFFFFSQDIYAQIQINWSPREDLNILLPESIRIHEGNGILQDSSRVHVVYATININDPHLTLLAKGSNETRQTTLEAYHEQDGILAINGGYFSSTQSVSLLLDNGKLVSPDRNKNVTRGAFGLVNGKPEISWAYVKNDILYHYPNPVNPLLNKTVEEIPWYPSQAVGGGPVLLKNGSIRVTYKEEGFGGSHLMRHPRSAIGYKNDSTLVMMVVDGRQAASVGVTLPELATIMQSIGCMEAVNLDGGGSSAMIGADEVVNIPVDKPAGDRNSLRKNASALIVTHSKPENKKKLILIDTDDLRYGEVGVWKDTNHNNYYGNTRSRTSVAHSFNKAIYKFDNIPNGHYQLAVWWTVASDNANAHYILHHGNEVDTVHLSQRALSTGGKWNVLGNFALQSSDYLEVIGDETQNKLITDAIRLVAHEVYPSLPKRGDVRIAVISDLNAGLGSATYEWQVDSIIKRLPRIWKPDLVLCGGDMVAGMGVKDSAVIKNMWEGFSNHILKPLQQNKIPFAFTIGNHDGTISHEAERNYTQEYWDTHLSQTGIDFIDQQHFPFYYSFKQDDVFIVSIDASSPFISSDNIKWLEQQLKSSHAQEAKVRLVTGHIPLFSVAQERDSKGNVLDSPIELQALFDKYDVRTYISGHQHAYYPGKKGKLELLNAGAAGSGPRRWLNRDDAPVNTITIADIFFEPDTIVYTTYDIREVHSAGMGIFDFKKLPSSISGVNGTILRVDVPYTSKGIGTLYFSNTKLATGNITATTSKNKLIIVGSITHDGSINPDNFTASLHSGKHTENGNPLTPLQIKKKGRKSLLISGEITLSERIREQLATGALNVRIENNTEVLSRTQIYSEKNQAPQHSMITSHSSQNVYGIRNTDALYTISWNEVLDLDGDFVDYTYQLAGDSLFHNIVMQKNTGRQNHLKIKEKDWYSLLSQGVSITSQIFFHRVTTSDGLHHSIGKTSILNLIKSRELPDDYIEIDPPQYTFNKIEDAAGAGSGAIFDKEEKRWLADYNGTLIVKTPDGKNASFSPLTSITINNTNYSLKPINGIGLDNDGNILLGNNRFLLKINATTGEGIAAWEVPEGARAITTPRVNKDGEIYAMSLFAEDPNYVLKQSITSPSTFELIRTLELKDRVLTRTFDMSDDGYTLYFPDPGSPFVQVYESKDGTSYVKKENIQSIAAGCNAIWSHEEKLFFAVRSSGIGPTTLHFRDDRKREMWTLPLPELNGAEPRGITVSPDGSTIIICCWDKGGGFYQYIFPK